MNYSCFALVTAKLSLDGSSRRVDIRATLPYLEGLVGLDIPQVGASQLVSSKRQLWYAEDKQRWNL